MRTDDTPKDQAQDAEEDAKIRKTLGLFERYIMAIVHAAPDGPMHPNEALKAVREEVVTFLKEEV